MSKSFICFLAGVFLVFAFTSCRNFLTGGKETLEKLNKEIEQSRAKEFFVDVRTNSSGDGRIVSSPAGGKVYDMVPFRVSFELNEDAGYFDCWKVFQIRDFGSYEEITEESIQDWYHGDRKLSDVLKIEEIDERIVGNIHTAEISISSNLADFYQIVIIPSIKNTVWHILPPEEGELSVYGDFHFKPGKPFELKYSSSKNILTGWEVLNAKGESVFISDSFRSGIGLGEDLIAYCEDVNACDNNGKFRDVDVEGNKIDDTLFRYISSRPEKGTTITYKFSVYEEWKILEVEKQDEYGTSWNTIETGYLDVNDFTLIPQLKKRPALLCTYPSKNERNVSVNSALELIFSKEIHLAKNDMSVLIIEHPGKKNMKYDENGLDYFLFEGNITGGSLSVFNIPLAQGKTLPVDSLISVTVSGSAMDEEYIPLGEDQTFTFRTVNSAD